MNKWLVLALGTMLLNGVVLTIQKCLPVCFTYQFLAVLFVIDGLICWAFVIALKRPVRLGHFALGAATGIISYIGNVFLIRSLSIGKASVVLPIVFGASMVIVTLVSAMGFRERLTPRGICALIVGIASVVILSRS